MHRREELRSLVSFDMAEDSNRRDQERQLQIPETSKIRNSFANHVVTADGAIDDFDLALFRKSPSSPRWAAAVCALEIDLGSPLALRASYFRLIMRTTTC